ncbi:MAG: lipoyl synthase [Candidatus Lambdaproteobacteria bacterium RIFOXYD1_FULL_56_27]|uniref:Lipoyl synthase n=1 Tax=Candidatus Lambdaproteobacteria bacterium RIFOXYD2_FULL_56_26 TaxID=1817773 RepID=A0A1F6GUR3_9PROT|nr:MAG: lipoyl synthase [Candidatus Lambdaproteobacteria bacterium RIFOXYD2_FULL_56_26]OGH02296.1 MAG: lipoyl synthase [Candidatus Lambdaproteobacteria bacterium RIFOXYC1_FULL_56_13]OGH10066.1 MAG: lipoyl synthase [Candidatus Lambdaproteobacteria bacterium RIFOXYD1_FULL_56_27]
MVVPKNLKKPAWLKVSLPKGQLFTDVSRQTHGQGLHTVCEEANCPNLGECWSSGTATFMLMGQECTRACRFCSVDTMGQPAPPDLEEPHKVARAAMALKLKYLVLTTVNRDDLPDQGVGHLTNVVETVQTANPNLLIELLFPDLRGDLGLVAKLLEKPPIVLGHNLECVRRVTPFVRDPRAGYDQSLQVLRFIKERRPQQWTKSSLMLGFGERTSEVLEAMADLRIAGVDFLTLGQYLQPTKYKLPVAEYVTPEKFSELEEEGRKMGFSYVAAGPLVRSSYKAFEYFMNRL